MCTYVDARSQTCAVVHIEAAEHCRTPRRKREEKSWQRRPRFGLRGLDAAFRRRLRCALSVRPSLPSALQSISCFRP
jgi:hypothetical protein